MPRKTVRPGPKGDEVKSYAHMDNLKRALRSAGILGAPHRVEEIRRHGVKHYKPVFMMDLPEDVRDLRERGFAAELVKPTAEAAE